MLLDIVRIHATADGAGRYCIALPDDDEYVLSFQGEDDHWGTVVWAEPTGGTLDVELR
ncbi:MAG: hypothetical protein U0228_17820 [Myxococcaceae bacterium]